MTIERRMQITAGVLVLFLLGTVLVIFWTSRQVERGLRVSGSVSQLIRYSYMLSTLLNEYQDHGNVRALEQWEKNREALGRTLNEMESEYRSIAPDLLESLQNAFGAVNSLSPQIPRLDALKTGDSQTQRARDMLSSLMFLRLEQLLKGANDLNRVIQARVLERRQFVEKTILIGGISLLVIVLANIFLIRKSVVQPLKELSAGAERIDAGNFDYVAETKHDDEVGRLAVAFNSMVGRLRDHTVLLKESEQKLRLFIEHAPTALAMFDTEMRYLAVSQRWMKDYRLDDGDIIGRSHYDVFPEIADSWKAVHRRGLQGEVVIANEDYFERLEGRGQWLRWEVRPWHDADGVIGGIIIFTEDITDHKKVEEALQKSRDELELRVQERTAELARASEAIATERQQLYGVLETMPIMVCLLTPDYHVAFANRSFREKFGESNGRHCFDYCFGMKEPCQFCESYNVLKTGKPHYWEVTGPDGSIIAAHDFPFADIDGSPLILEMDIDITEQRRAAESIKAERQRLYDVLESLPVYVCLLDADYRMPFANRNFRENFGESQGRRCYEFLFNRTEPCEICETFTVMKTRAPHHWYWTGPNGKDYDIYDFPFTDTDGSRLILEMGIDITERKKAEEKLQRTLTDLTRSNEDLQQFAYVASHDLQEPLRNVASCLQMLEKDYKSKIDATADQYIHYAVDSSVRMKDLILGLLAYSRVSTKGKLPQLTDCEQVLDSTLKNLHSTIAETGAVITHDPLPKISGDDAQLLQVFQNLIGNAIKFRSDRRPQIHISAIKNEKEWIFSIKDNGIGIESQHFDRIFVIFQRLHKRSEYQGTGMGLAIVKKIVERHGGRVWVESEPGVGTTFYFGMPEKAIQA